MCEEVLKPKHTPGRAAEFVVVVICAEGPLKPALTLGMARSTDRCMSEISPLHDRPLHQNDPETRSIAGSGGPVDCEYSQIILFLGTAKRSFAPWI